jgi:hypothetical protein
MSVMLRLLIAAAVWAVTALIMSAYLEAVNNIVDYMKEFHGSAWARLNRRFMFGRGSARNVYFRPRKTAALEEIIWCWPRPLRHRELDRMIGKVRTLTIVASLFIGASMIALALAFPDRPLKFR